MVAHLDHIVIAGPVLAGLESWWAAALGDAPAPGGAHTGRGTRNALVGLGGRSYVELIGPDTEQDPFTGARPFGLNDRVDIGLATMAISVPDLDAAVAVYRSHGLDPGEPRPMRRIRPDGIELSWRLAVPEDPSLGGVLPFLIEWGPSTPHPAADLKPEVELSSLALQHPEGERMSAALAEMECDLRVEVGDASLAATFTSAGLTLSV